MILNLFSIAVVTAVFLIGLVARGKKLFYTLLLILVRLFLHYNATIEDKRPKNYSLLIYNILQYRTGEVDKRDLT